MPPTATQLRETLVEMIVGAAGGDPDKWRAVIGKVEVLPLTMNIKGNWRVAPKGSKRDRDVVEQAVAILRAAQPYAKEG